MTSRDLARRRWVLLALTAAVVVIVALLDRNRTAFSALNRTLFLRELAFIGLLTLGQQLVRAVGGEDLSAGAVIALVAALVVGLEQALSPLGAVVASLAVAGVVGVSCGVTVALTGAPAALVTAVPLVLVPAALPFAGTLLASEGLRSFAYGSPGMSDIPWLLLVYLGLLAMALPAVRPRFPALEHDARTIAAFGAAGLVWGVLGVWTAGRVGSGGGAAVWPAAAGLGAALLACATRQRRLDPLTGAMAALLVALLFNGLDVLGSMAGGETSEGGRQIVSALLLLAGLVVARPWPAPPAAASGSAHADEAEPDTGDLPPARVDELRAEGPLLAGGDEDQRHDA